MQKATRSCLLPATQSIGGRGRGRGRGLRPQVSLLYQGATGGSTASEDYDAAIGPGPASQFSVSDFFLNEPDRVESRPGSPANLDLHSPLTSTVKVYNMVFFVLRFLFCLF